MEAVIDKPVFSTVIHKDDIMSVDLGLKDFGVFINKGKPKHRMTVNQINKF